MSRLALLPDDIIAQIMNLAIEPFEKAARLIQRMLRGTHSRYKLFANLIDILPEAPPFMAQFYYINGSIRKLSLDHDSGEKNRGCHSVFQKYST